MSGQHGQQHQQQNGLRTASSRAARPLTMGALVAVALATGIAIGSGSPGLGALPLPGGSPEPVKLDDASPVALHTGQTCSSLLDHYRATARDEVTPWGLGSVMGGGVMADGMRVPVAAADSSRTMGGAAPTPLSSSPAQESNSGRSEAGTTVQVQGVDEADLAKRAGDLLLTVNPGADTFLRVLRTDAGSGSVRQVGAVELTNIPTSLLVEGNTVLVIGQALSGVNPVASGAEMDRMMMPWRAPATRMDQIDISDPSRPKLVSSLVVDASVAGARMVDGVAQLALTSSPGLVFPGPSDASQPNEKKMLESNRGVVDDSTIEDWLPRARFTETDGLATTQPLVACTDVAVPAEPAGVSTLTLLSADLRGGGLAQRRTTAVVASGTTLYADAEQTVVAMPQGGWRAWPADAAAGTPTRSSTVLHVFARQGRETVRYVASGEVPGQILNQFSIDAYDGYLRVATTEEPVAVPVPMAQPMEDSASTPGSTGSGDTVIVDSETIEPQVIAPPTPGTTQSRVTVLHREGKQLVTVGTVQGLGKGERIYAVRFMGDLAYVVTFRQTDPLYVIDLSDPAAPRTAGELKIPGYSAYLQSAGEGLLLGLGQDADAQGRVKGLQLSLFDVTKPTAPQRIANLALPNAFSEAEFDHHAFTLADNLVLVPYSKNASAGLVATRLDGRSLTEATLLSRGQVAPQRSFVDGGHIWSVGPDGVVAYDVSSLERTGSVRYGL